MESNDNRSFRTDILPSVEPEIHVVLKLSLHRMLNAVQAVIN